MCSVLIDQCDKLGVRVTLWEETLSSGHQCVPGWGAQDSEGFALDSWTSHAAIPISSKKETECTKKEIGGRKRWVTGMGSFIHSLKTLPSFKMRGMRISKKQCWRRVGTPQEPRRDGSEKHPQQSEKFLSTKRYCIIPYAQTKTQISAPYFHL